MTVPILYAAFRTSSAAGTAFDAKDGIDGMELLLLTRNRFGGTDSYTGSAAYT
jgi:hypothetical protein